MLQFMQEEMHREHQMMLVEQAQKARLVQEAQRGQIESGYRKFMAQIGRGKAK